MKANNCSCGHAFFWQLVGDDKPRCERCDPPAGRPIRRRALFDGVGWRIIYDSQAEEKTPARRQRKKPQYCADGLCWQDEKRWQKKPSKKHRGLIAVSCRECGKFIAYEKKEGQKAKAAAGKMTPCR